MRCAMFLVTAALAVLGITGCGADDRGATDNGDGPMSLNVTSPAFAHEKAIPSKHTCDGEDISPPLEWTTGPDGTASYALIMDDPDAPMGTWVHWVLYNIPEPRLAEGLTNDAERQRGFGQGANSWKRTGYGGPCPPSGTHRYFFKVYALDTTLSFVMTPNKDNLLTAMKGHILAQGELMGTYARSK